MNYGLDPSLLSMNLRKNPRFKAFLLHWPESNDHMSTHMYSALSPGTRK